MRAGSLGLVLVAAAVGAAACDRAPEPPVAHVPSVADSAEQVLVQTSSMLTNGGVKRGTLTADTAFVFDDQNRFDLRNVHVTFTTVTGDSSGTMRADSGRYNRRTNILDGWGHVVITTTDGKRLETPQLRYNQGTNQVSSDTSFVLTEGNKVSRGIGFTADPDLKVIKVLRGAGGSGVITSLPSH